MVMLSKTYPSLPTTQFPASTGRYVFGETEEEPEERHFAPWANRHGASPFTFRWLSIPTMTVEEEQQQPIVKMRGERQPLSATANTNAQVHSALARGLEALNEGEITEETEEIRKLDTQLDHLNDYMAKMEERLKAHNDRMLETLKQQKEEREKRRRSFHERMNQTQGEDEEFRKQMANILKRVESVRQSQTNNVKQ
ncbi:unnamed protein product [Caenorhabditis auriculariae]|uniref:Uncharacterized protein n=1 Tax=Caenorhabditis auriculariae TaxID=2777116 RepID=A0A8S1GWE8_9PELO|nr:unnamed protein product [Caenorhabditis auriculariae]